MTDTITKLEHPAAAALRELFPAPIKQAEGHWLDNGIEGNLDGVLEDMRAQQINAVDERTLETSIKRLHAARSALTASAAYDEAVAECVAALRKIRNHWNDLHPKDYQQATAALARITKLGVR